MTDSRPVETDKLLNALRERAKELNCLYAVEECLANPDTSIPEACEKIIQAIPPGWQYPSICQARIQVDEKEYRSPGWVESPWKQVADIVILDVTVGWIEVSYTEEVPAEDHGPFLKEETRLIRTIADRIAQFIHHQQMKLHFEKLASARQDLTSRKREDWRIIMDLLLHTDKNLFMKISHMMLNQLCWSGVKEAEALLEKADLLRKGDEELVSESNIPYRKRRYSFPRELAEEAFRIAAKHMSDEEILFRIQKWMQEDKLGFLVRAVERNLALPDVADAIRRYHHLTSDEKELSQPTRNVVRVSLIRRFLSDQLPYIKVAKEYLEINDFHDLLQYMIFSSDSMGRLGGKSAGLYLAAQILRKERKNYPELGEIRIPRTWHITSDMQLHFMHFNNLDEIVEQKYKEMSQIRFEYPHIVHTCKNSRFPPEFIKGLSVAMDDLGEVPLIVRSSSVLEDRVGAAFSGKYKSLFLANQGSKQARLEALLDAVAEVYASMFAPDPIEYRAERGLLDFAEEMGIMIEEVVGTRVGPYYLPLFGGVAFSRNEFRWSPRIRREDGLIRMVPGLGTRAVDRVSDDYPVLFAPGQPGLRVNSSPDEIMRYSPRWLDVLNLEENRFETVECVSFFKKYGDQIPGLEKIVSIHEAGHFRRPTLADTDLADRDIVVTFEGLMSDQRFVNQMRTILRVLEDKIGEAVDIEFAHDGREFHLLQCRVQSYSDRSGPAPIPKDLPRENIVFTAKKYISNGDVPDITHIVYVDPERYVSLPDRRSLLEVGRAISKLNQVLPKRQFILMGPGRWGSRGDLKLGVHVTYSDINNTAVLIEIARMKGNYTPDLSFGTHFFQDLVEARIRYIPLYPDDEGVDFNETFLRRSPNIFSLLVPGCTGIEDAVHVIDVPRVTGGKILRVLMNADLDEAVGYLAEPSTTSSGTVDVDVERPAYSSAHWQWRMRMVEQIARRLDRRRFGVEALYVFGSTKNCTAGPASDIDILVHFKGSKAQRRALEEWLDGWSKCLDEMNYLRTGYRSDGLLDVHMVTDQDIEKETSWAVKIGALTDPAKKLPLE